MISEEDNYPTEFRVTSVALVNDITENNNPASPNSPALSSPAPLGASLELLESDRSCQPEQQPQQQPQQMQQQLDKNQNSGFATTAMNSKEKPVFSFFDIVNFDDNSLHRPRTSTRETPQPQQHQQQRQCSPSYEPAANQEALASYLSPSTQQQQQPHTTLANSSLIRNGSSSSISVVNDTLSELERFTTFYVDRNLIEEEDKLDHRRPLAALSDVQYGFSSRFQLKTFNVVALIDKAISSTMTLFDEENTSLEVKLLKDPFQKGQPVILINPDLIRGNIVCVRGMWAPNSNGVCCARLADIVVVNPFLRDRDGPIKNGKRVTRDELARIHKLTLHLTSSLTSPAAVYTRQVFEIVDLIGQVLAMRVTSKKKTELFLYLPHSTAWPPFFNTNLDLHPLRFVPKCVADNAAPQFKETITLELVKRLLREDRLLVVHLFDDHSLWAQGQVRIGQTVVLFGVHTRRDLYMQAVEGQHKLYSLHGGMPGQRRLVLGGSIFGNKMSTSIEACFSALVRPTPPPLQPLALKRASTASTSSATAATDDFAAFFEDDFEEALNEAHFTPVKRQTKEEEKGTKEKEGDKETGDGKENHNLYFHVS